jgi:hypothetical protein
LKIDITPAGAMDVYDTLKFTFSEPVLPFKTNLINIQQKVDTLWEDRDYPILQDTLNPRKYYIDFRWPYNQEFQIRIDSASLFSIYGKWNDSINVKFKTKAEEEYGDLYISITGSEGPGFGQLLDGSEKIVRETPLENGDLVFEDLKPGKYFLRYIEDFNGNGQWDTGNYAENRQPEPVYYYPGFFEIKKYWSFEQPWNITELPVDKQKPLEITKNKPKEKQPKRDDKKNENQKNSNSRAPSGIPGMSGMPRL